MKTKPKSVGTVNNGSRSKHYLLTRSNQNRSLSKYSKVDQKYFKVDQGGSNKTRIR